MKARVDPEICIGCTLCAEVCPEVYRMEGDKAVAYLSPIPKNLEASAKQGAEDCPVDAIIIEE
ncbi:MAG: ferredoxin [Omnitrophica bacterium RIFCSPLOWO2_01_FULL_45_10]|nr:MAG: ferredoxin [Omnitrophica bacterium RIFCSPLOWO2_01_FULL_45_10]